MSETTDSFHWTILRVGSLRECLDAWQASRLYSRLDDALRQASSTVLDELGSNFLRFSGPKAKEMKVSMIFKDKVLTMTFDDDGEPFDPGKVLPPPSANIALLPVGGRGLHMARQSVDSWSYHHKSKRNISVLSRRVRDNPLEEEPAKAS